MIKIALKQSVLLLVSLLSLSSTFAGTKNAFEGAYIGANYGYGLGYVPVFTGNTYTDPDSGQIYEQTFNRANLGLKGKLGGLYAGYHHLLPHAYLVGIEVSKDFNSISQLEGSKICNDIEMYSNEDDEYFQYNVSPEKIQTKRKSSLELSLKLGKIFEPSFMSYLKVGLAKTRWDTNLQVPQYVYPQDYVHHHQRLRGIDIGIGSEFFLLPNLNLGIEGNYTFYRHTSKINLLGGQATFNDITYLETTSVRIKPKTLDMRLRLQWYIA